MVKGNNKGSSRSYSSLRRFGYFRAFVICALVLFVVSASIFSFYLPGEASSASGSWLRTSRQKLASSLPVRRAEEGRANDAVHGGASLAAAAAGFDAEKGAPSQLQVGDNKLRDYRSPEGTFLYVGLFLLSMFPLPQPLC